MDRIERSLALLQARTLAEDFGIEILVRPNYGSPLRIGQVLDALDDWVGILSPTGKGYRYLYETLQAMPSGIPAGLITQFPHVHLSRPITDRLELVATLFSVERDGATKHSDVFQRSRSLDVRKAMSEATNFNHRDYHPRRSMDVRDFVYFACDYPREHTGNMLGLTRKSIRWHRDELQEFQGRIIAALGPDTQTTRPPIELPAQPEIRLLRTVQEVCDEGAHMDNCVATYANEAAQGHHYLFHVERDGEEATVQVDPRGRVVQAHGPRNRPNSAASWARRVLNSWGLDFPAGLDPLPAVPF
jgi:hypothetical protein